MSELSDSQAYAVVEAVLDQTSRIAGDTRIVFLSDPLVQHRAWQYQNMEKRLETWGDTFLGTYHTQTDLLKLSDQHPAINNEMSVGTPRRNE